MLGEVRINNIIGTVYIIGSQSFGSGFFKNIVKNSGLRWPQTTHFSIISVVSQVPQTSC